MAPRTDLDSDAVPETASRAPATKPREAEPQAGRGFVPTRWSVVLKAAHQAGPGAEQALATLCETYWFPLYAFVRRQGHSPQDAEDLTQAFFARLLEKALPRKHPARRRPFPLLFAHGIESDFWPMNGIARARKSEAANGRLLRWTARPPNPAIRSNQRTR
jgi:hypothetical protein